jgi:hypothetical protein
MNTCTCINTVRFINYNTRYQYNFPGHFPFQDSTIGPLYIVYLCHITLSIERMYDIAKILLKLALNTNQSINWIVTFSKLTSNCQLVMINILQICIRLVPMLKQNFSGKTWLSLFVIMHKNVPLLKCIKYKHLEKQIISNYLSTITENDETLEWILIYCLVQKIKITQFSTCTYLHNSLHVHIYMTFVLYCFCLILFALFLFCVFFSQANYKME